MLSITAIGLLWTGVFSFFTLGTLYMARRSDTPSMLRPIYYVVSGITAGVALCNTALLVMYVITFWRHP